MTSRPALLATLAALAPLAAAAQDRAAVIETYADIAAATFGDTATAAHVLEDAVKTLVDSPSDEALKTARAAWVTARESYQQSEVFRFGNPIVDDWEGQVNSWPLDEGLIDYVDASYGGATDENPFAALNVVATPKFTLGNTEIDATEITPELISGPLQAADGIDTNVATGWHAIEFLLWGQDLHGTEAGAGERPWTDYAQGADCTNGNCDRRAAYLTAATALLVQDMDWITAQWADDGAARANLTADPDAAIGAMLTGIGSLSYGELAGERMQLGLLLHDPEEEHDCFSDNTHNSAYYDVLGIENVWLGRYARTDGTAIDGPSLEDLVAAADPAASQEVTDAIAHTMELMGAVKAAGDGGEAWDQMLAMGNTEGNARLQDAIEGLKAQTKALERAIAVLNVTSTIEGSDSLQ